MRLRYQAINEITSQKVKNNDYSQKKNYHIALRIYLFCKMGLCFEQHFRELLHTLFVQCDDVFLIISRLHFNLKVLRCQKN